MQTRAASRRLAVMGSHTRAYAIGGAGVPRLLLELQRDRGIDDREVIRAAKSKTPQSPETGSPGSLVLAEYCIRLKTDSDREGHARSCWIPPIH